ESDQLRQDRLYLLLLLGSERSEHVVGPIARPAVGERADADAQAGVLLGLQRVLDALQAVMAAGGPVGPQAEGAARDAELVDQDEEVGRGSEGGIGGERREGGGARVHVGGGLELVGGEA